MLGIGDTPGADVRAELAANLDDYVFVRDMHDRDAMIRAGGLLTFRHGRIDRIDSLNEHWLDVEADLRASFGVVGPGPEDRRRSRSKTRMKEIFRSVGAETPAGVAATTAAAVRDFVVRHGLPVLFKPDFGVGAQGAFKVSTMEELDGALQALAPGYVVEEFVVGTLISYDGLTDRAGEIVYEMSTVVSEGVMEIVQRQGPVHYYSVRAIPAAVAEPARRIVKAFGLSERFFHVEAFRTPSGGVKFLEINVRPPGGFGVDMMNFTADADLYDMWARVVTQGFAGNDKPPEPKYYCAHIGRRHHIAYRRPAAAVVADVRPLLVLHEPCPTAFATAMGDEVFMVRHAELSALQQVIDHIEQTA